MKASAGSRVLMMVENNSYPEDHRVRLEATALMSAGYHVTVISPGSKSHSWHEHIDGVRVFRYPAPAAGGGVMGYLWEYGYSTVACFFLSLLVFVRFGFDVIHAHNPPDLFVMIALFYRPWGTRFVFDHHDLSPEMYRARFRSGGNRLVFNALVLFEKLSCRLADHVIATNESYKRVEMERSGIPENKISVVRNGPNLARVRLVEPDRGLRKRAGTVIGYVGVMGFQDGIDYLLRSLHRLKHDLARHDFFCVLVGTGDAHDSLRQLTNELDIADQVWFTGPVPDADMLRCLSTADVCVAPDPSNPFTDRSTMIKIMEYMTLSKPIVAFDLPEHRASAGHAALYAKPNDELDFAGQIAKLMDEPELRQRMGEDGRRRVETELAWKFQIGKLLSAYETLGLCPAKPPARNAGARSETSPSEELTPI